MHFQLIDKNKKPMLSLWQGIWLAALLGALLSLIDSMQYIATAIPGVAMVIAAGFLPKKWKWAIGAACLGSCLLWLGLRFAPIVDGLAFLTNRLFTLSEESQNYYYIHFNAVGYATTESLLFLSCFLGVLCVLVGGAFYLALTLLLAVVIAYFGVSPDIVWVCILITIAFANALPKRGRWIPAILIAIFVAVTAFSLQTIDPDPNVRINYIAEDLWDMIVPPDPPQMEETAPTDMTDMTDFTDVTEMPELPDLEDLATMETLPGMQIPPGLQGNPQATGGLRVPQAEQVSKPTKPGTEKTEKKSKPIPILPILVTLLSLAAVGGVWMLIVAQKRKRNRAAMYVQNNAEAIRGMYLYARRWRAMNDSPGVIRPEVEAIWLEAAFSEHEMTDAQREGMLSFVRYSAADTWNKLTWWERLIVSFITAL